MTKLSELLNGTPLSARQAADKAAELGVALPYGTIAAYWAGKHPKTPSERTLEGLAEVTQLPLRQIRRAAGFPPGEDTVWVPPREANRLSARQRAAVEELILSIALGTVTAEQGEDRSGIARDVGSQNPRVNRAKDGKKGHQLGRKQV